MANTKIGRPKGHPKTGGRQKGTPNKTTRLVKDIILGEFDLEEFRAWKQKNPDAYYTRMVMGILPKEITGDIDGTVSIIVHDVLKAPAPTPEIEHYPPALPSPKVRR
jgi:hypothetical protein